MVFLDEEEIDWKVIVIDVNDFLVFKFNDVEDVECYFFGFLWVINEWFCIYKIFDGKFEN